MGATFTSRLFGIVRTRVLAQVFGSGATADVINFTFNIPNNFRKLFGEGAVNSALIPAFSALHSEEERSARQRLFSLLCTYQILLFVPIVLISYVWRESLIAFLSDFDAQQITLGGQLLAPFMLYLTFISLAAIFGGVLQSHHSFLIAYVSPLFFSLLVIAGVLTLTPIMGPMSMAVSTVLGGGMQAAVNYLGVRRHGYRLRFALDGGGTALAKVLKAWALVSIGMGVQVATQLITYRFASTLSVGSVTALANSTIFHQTPYGIFFNAIAAVSLPLLSTAHTLGQHKRVQTITAGALGALASLLLPSSIILFFLSRESVSTILQAGLFTHESALLTAQVLRTYLIFLTPMAFYAMMLRLGYSAHRHRMMTRVVVVQNGVDIALMWILLKSGVGIAALPLANGISVIGGFIALCIILADLYPIHRDRGLRRRLGRIILANVPLLSAGLLYRHLGTVWYHDGSTWKNLALLAILGLGAVALVLASYHVAKIPLIELLKQSDEGDLGLLGIDDLEV